MGRPGRRTRGWTSGCSNEEKWTDGKSGSVKEASGLAECREGDKSVKGDSQLSALTKHVNCDSVCCDGEERERWVIFLSVFCAIRKLQRVQHVGVLSLKCL